MRISKGKNNKINKIINILCHVKKNISNNFIVRREIIARKFGAGSEEDKGKLSLQKRRLTLFAEG